MPCTKVAVGDFVTEGERLAAEVVHEYLAARPESWVQIVNVLAHLGTSPREIDQIVIGPTGVYVIDVKSFGGTVRSDGGFWILDDASRRRDPIAAVHHVASSVKGRLAKSSALLANTWVSGVLLFTAETVNLKQVEGTDGTCFSLRNLDQLFALRAGAAGLSEQQVNLAFKTFHSSGFLRVRNSLTQVGDFRLEAPLGVPETPHRQSYRATDRHRTPCVVRLYDLSTVPPSQRKKAMQQARSEFEALSAASRARVPGLVRILMPFSEVPEHGGELYHFAVEAPQGPTLADRLADPRWSREERFEFAQDLCRTLARIHATPIPDRPDQTLVHRRLNPESIYLLPGQGPERFLLSGFDVARSTGTTAYPDRPPFDLTAYDAPELREGLVRASHRSDIYSLGIMMYELFTGRLPERQAGQALPPLKEEEAPSPSMVRGWHDLLEMMIELDPERRPENLDQVLALWDDLPPAPPPPPRLVLHPLPMGSPLGEGLQVEQLLGRGGAAWTYLVRDSHQMKRYVAKVLRHQDEPFVDGIRREFGLLQMCNHPALVKVFEVATRETSPYHLLLEYCEGEAMEDVAVLLPLLAEDRGTDPVTLVTRWTRDLLGALAQVHGKGVYHGDISPRNLLLSESGPRLIDFGLGGLRSEDGTALPRGGTFPYSLPEAREGARDPVQRDLYGLAATMAHVLLGRVPFEDQEGIRQDRCREELSTGQTPLHQVLFQALTRSGFKNAAEMAQAFDQPASEKPAPPVAGEAFEEEPEAPPATVEETWNQVPYLDELLKLYPASKLGASETRGLETDLARETYVETLMDRELPGAIQRGEVHLVLLSGNPGDGKTAFLQKLAAHFGCAPEELQGQREWEVRLADGRRVRANLDASASIGERSSDEVLDAFLAAFLDGPPPDQTALVAINDGRLLEWLEDQDEERWLFKTLRHLVEERHSQDPGVLLIDLNDRSLVGHLDQDEQGSVFARLLRRLVEGAEGRPDPWAPCQSCLARTRCPVRFNVETLRDQAGALALGRAEMLLRTVHFRNRVHITMRQLRGALSYWFFGTRTCQEIHQAVQTPTAPRCKTEPDASDQPIPLESQLYFNTLFEGPETVVPLLMQLKELDPGQVDHPVLDRHLFLRGAARSRQKLPTFKKREFAWQDEPGAFMGESDADLEWLRRLRRQLFFETPEADFRRLELGQPADLLPFPSLTRFQQAVSDEEAAGDLTRWVCKALSRSAGVPDRIVDGGRLFVRMYDDAFTTTQFYRTFDVGQFQAEVDRRFQASRFVEILPTWFRVHAGQDSGVELQVDLELFEVLDRLARGYRPGNPEADAFLGNLELFRKRLLRMPGPEDPILVFHPNHGLRQVRAWYDEASKKRILALEEAELS